MEALTCQSKNMDRRYFIFSVVLAVSITLKPIPITALPKDEPPSASKSSNSPSQDKTQSKGRTKNQNDPQTPTQIIVTTPDISATDKATSDTYQQREVAAQETMAALTRALTYVAIVQAFITGFALLAAIKALRANVDETTRWVDREEVTVQVVWEVTEEPEELPESITATSTPVPALARMPMPSSAATRRTPLGSVCAVSDVYGSAVSGCRVCRG
jgi:hypothetical protein